MLGHVYEQQGRFSDAIASLQKARQIEDQISVPLLMTLTPFPVLVNYIGFLLNFFAVVAVTSLLIFRRGQHWEKLRAVSFGAAALASTL